jgi:uracil-DNA glycosylase family 4
MSKKKEVSDPLHQYQGSKLEQLQQLCGQWQSCTKCILGEMRVQEEAYGPVNPPVFGEGNPDASILIVGEAPGEEEMAQGLPFIGASGKLLNQMLAATIPDPVINAAQTEYSRKAHTQARTAEYHALITNWRHDNLFVTNTIACHPPENRTPTKDEITACWDRLWNIIYTVDPLVIVALGNTALSAVTKRSQKSISTARGKVFDMEYKGRLRRVVYPVVPMFHPAYLLRVADWKVKGGDFDKTLEDWRKVFKMVDFLKTQNR